MPLTYWIVNLIGLAAVTYLLLRLRRKHGGLVPHVHFFSISWGVTLLISQVVMGGLIAPDLIIIVILYGAWCAFLLAASLPSNRGKQFDGPQPIKKGAGLVILVVLILLQITAVWYEINSTGISFGSELLFQLVQLRLSGALSNVELPLFLNVFRWDHTLYVPLALLLFSRRYISRNVVALILGMAVFASVLHFTRAPMIQLVIVGLVSWMIIFRPTRRSLVIGSGTIVLATIIFFVFTQGAIFDSARRTSVSAARSSVSESMLGYVGLSPRAYQTIVYEQYPRLEGYYTFDAFYFVLSKFADVSYPGLNRSYIEYPLVTNIYTFLDCFTLDFGVAGALIGAALIGLGSSWIYLQAKFRPSVFSVVVYAYSTYACVMAIANNEFIRFGYVLTSAIALLIHLVIQDRSAKKVESSVQSRERHFVEPSYSLR